MSTIEYTTGADGWGDCEEPSDDDVATFCALVVHRLEQRFPGVEATAEVDARYLESRIDSDMDLDREEIVSWIGVDVWNDWCSGERAPEVA